VYQDLLILTFDGADYQYVQALDKATGKSQWKQDRKIKYKTDNGDYKKAYSTPQVIMVQGEPQLVSPAAEQTVAYNPKTGTEIWRVSHGGMNESIRPVLVCDMIILNSGHTANLLAVKIGQTGTVPNEGIAWRYDKKAPTRPSVLAIKDHIFMVSDNGIATCLEAKTGKRKWEERVDGQFSASPIFVDGKIIVPNEQGKTHVFAADTEKFVGLSVNKLDAGCMASPAAVGDTLYLRTKTHLYAIGK
jgi:outer membrane protein assembly factor BamB